MSQHRGWRERAWLLFLLLRRARSARLCAVCPAKPYSLSKGRAHPNAYATVVALHTRAAVRRCLCSRHGLSPPSGPGLKVLSSSTSTNNLHTRDLVCIGPTSLKPHLQTPCTVKVMHHPNTSLELLQRCVLSVRGITCRRRQQHSICRGGFHSSAEQGSSCPHVFRTAVDQTWLQLSLLWPQANTSCRFAAFRQDLLGSLLIT